MPASTAAEAQPVQTSFADEEAYLAHVAALRAARWPEGLPRAAQASASVLGENFPDSPWYQDSYALLRGHGLEPREGSSDSWFASATKKITGAS